MFNALSQTGTPQNKSNITGEKETKKLPPQNKEGLDDVRWPFEPPHLNLNLPSKQNKKDPKIQKNNKMVFLVQSHLKTR